MKTHIHIRCEGPAPDWKILPQPALAPQSRYKTWRVFPADQRGRPVGRVYTFREYFPALILMRRMARDHGRLNFHRILTTF